MAFLDDDPLEQDMGVRCEDMVPDQLVAYIKSWQGAFGLDVRIDGHPERGVFRGMHRIYGQRDTGLIVKWAFYKHKGRREDGAPVTPLSFAKGRKWWVDKMHLEMQEALRRETARSAAPAGLGVVSLLDL